MMSQADLERQVIAGCGQIQVSAWRTAKVFVLHVEQEGLLRKRKLLTHGVAPLIQDVVIGAKDAQDVEVDAQEAIPRTMV